MTPSKTLEELEPGQELQRVEYSLSPEMVALWALATEDFHPWYFGDSPFGGPVAHPTIIHSELYRMRAKNFPPPSEDAGMHIAYDAEYIDPARVGEKITIRGRCTRTYVKRGRNYAELFLETFGQDGRPICRYNFTYLLSYKKDHQ